MQRWIVRLLCARRPVRRSHARIAVSGAASNYAHLGLHRESSEIGQRIWLHIVRPRDEEIAMFIDLPLVTQPSELLWDLDGTSRSRRLSTADQRRRSGVNDGTTT